MIFRYTSTKINMNIYYQTMNEIITLIKIAMDYCYDGKHFNERTVTIDEGVKYYTFNNEDYDEHYRICYEAATNFINTSDVFSELKPEEITKAFTGMVFKNNKVLIGTLFHAYSHYLRLFKEILRVNKEMLVALIKATIDEKITPIRFYYFMDVNDVLGANRNVPDAAIIRMYRILLEYNHFSLDNLNLEKFVNEISPIMTKRAV